jgi:serine/threonine protein kinase
MMTAVQQIGRYQILGELGRGAMGIVYKAQDPAIGRTIAIKSIRLQDLTSEAERERLRERLVREAQSAGVLSHPGIVTIYDIAEQDGMAYIFMEFVQGEPLERMLLAEQTPDGETLLSILRQTAAALDYAHRKGIVHRDIKPANIMIHEDGSAKVTDFGVAKIMSQSMTVAGTMMGTPSYMSPEQVEGAAVNGRADQFSLAVIAYEVLTGEKPFAAEYLPSLLYKIVREDPVAPQRLNTTLGTAVEPVLRRALAKKQDDRYDTCSEFISALSAACNASEGWTPLPRGASPNLPTAGTTGGGTEIAAVPPSLPMVDGAPPHMAVLPPAPVSDPPPLPVVIQPPSPYQAPSSSPTTLLSETPPLSQAPSMVVERRLSSDSIASERESSKALRNVILAAAGVALACVGGFVAFQWYNSPSVSQLIPLAAPSGTASATNPPPPAAAPTVVAPPPPPPPSDSTPAPASDSPAPTTADGSPVPPTEPAVTKEATEKTAATAKASKAAAKAAAATGKKSPPSSNPTEANSAFQLTTSPSGAVAVFDDDPGVQCVSPCKVTLPTGRHTISLHHAGYRDARRIIEVPRDPGLIVDLSAMTGTLSVSTTPPGLVVVVDGQTEARKTPLSINLAVGQHRVEVYKGTERQTLTVDISDGQISTKIIDWP